VSNISKENYGTKYLLFVIDIYSKLLWIEPLKNKTGKEFVNALKNIFSKGRKCRTFRVDCGKEFSNSHVMNYLKDEDVYFFTTQNSDAKANYAKESFNPLKI
jgi:IS30 family transposase